MPGASKTRYDFSEQSPVLAVVTAVAARTGADPCDLPPLETVIDTEALETFLAATARRSANGRVTFTYGGYAVTVRSNGTVTVDGGQEGLPDELDDGPGDDANGHRAGGE